MDLVELISASRARSSPSAFLMASVSSLSFRGVPVPWALMYSVRLGAQPASCMARHMACAPPTASGMRRGDVIGVAGVAVAHDLGIDLRAARLGVLIFLQHEDARALAHDKALPARVEGQGGLGRDPLASAQRHACW